ncbi:integral membrane sensor signal transduction histidine kinase (plasmid) [Chondrocystis sp. NIES-4102]|nr:integral membrane sensor signal transduction histidine kinase [Chondrocystis sp. NIES-4102]
MKFIRNNKPLKNLIIFLILILLITNVFFKGIVKYINLKIYDFNFLIRGFETIDERIVTVGWDERSIKFFQETIISDNTLSVVLDKISQQQPRVIALDLYRDLPVFSPRLTDELNIKAYNDLQKLFNSIPNIIGIEKVVNPIINSPTILKNRKLVASSDIPIDIDNIIRRSFVFPEENKKGEPAGIPYLGVAVGFQYLSAEGWNAVASKDGNHHLSILNGRKSILINPVNNFAGISEHNQYGYNFLVNWRKAKPAFNKVSIIDVINNEVDLQLFNDRVVIIGNVSASTADRHFIPLNHWSSLQWSYGLEIPAQVASSIISAALDDRPLLSTTSKLNNFIFLIIIIFLIIKYQNKLIIYNNTKDYAVKLLYFIMGTSIIIFIINIISFNIGLWLPICIPIIVIWMLYALLVFTFYLNYENKNKNELNLYMQNINYLYIDSLERIYFNINKIKDVSKKLELLLIKKDQSDIKANIISKRIVNIEIYIDKVKRQRKSLEELIYFNYINNNNKFDKIIVNQLVNNLIERLIQENSYFKYIKINTIFDPYLSVKKVVINVKAIEIVLENLLDNAFYCVNLQVFNKKPIITIKTLYSNNFLYISVKNNGFGVPKHLHKEIFEPFSYQGEQGVELYLSKKIVNFYRGNIEVKSDLDNDGIEFTCVLPVYSS